MFWVLTFCKNDTIIIIPHKKVYVYTFFYHFSINSDNFMLCEVRSVAGYSVVSTLSIRELYTISKQKFGGGYFFGGESHSYYEAVCVLKGKVGITAGKNVYVLEAGQMTLHVPHEFHAIWEEGQSAPEVIVFTFSASAFPKVKSGTYLLTPKLLKEIKDIYKASHDIFIMKGNDCYYGDSGKTVFQNGMFISGVADGMELQAECFVKRIELFLSYALKSLLDEKREYTAVGSESYTRILAVMEENIYNNLSVGEIASIAGVSVPTLEKTVYRYMHCGAIAYYNILRMERAHSLMRKGNSVKETSDALGFSNQNYFSACFKKRYGISPSKLKNGGK